MNNISLAASIKKVEDGLYELRMQAGQLAAENTRLKDGHSNAKKLSTRDVDRIREMHSRSSFSQRQLAQMFDVAPPTISRIVRRVYWK